jgi:hypothetical protein
MQTITAGLLDSLSTLGHSNPALLLGCSLIAPAALTFGVVYVVRKSMAVCWRGYWDVV